MSSLKFHTSLYHNVFHGRPRGSAGDLRTPNKQPDRGFPRPGSGHEPNARHTPNAFESLIGGRNLHGSLTKDPRRNSISPAEHEASSARAAFHENPVTHDLGATHLSQPLHTESHIDTVMVASVSDMVGADLQTFEETHEPFAYTEHESAFAGTKRFVDLNVSRPVTETTLPVHELSVPEESLRNEASMTNAHSGDIASSQHAAHERVGFEKLKLEYDRSGIRSQPLLIPETFDLKPSDTEMLQNYLGEIGKFGFEIEFFGGHTFVLKAVPALLKEVGDIRRLIADWIDDIKATGSLVSLTDRWHHMLATTACHAQIRANHHLTLAESQALLRELEEYQFTDFCPHGRPVSVEVTKDEIEKWFKRVL